MTNSNSTLLTAEERRILYEVPVLNDIERNEYFTFTHDEIEKLHAFNQIDHAVYFSISLAFYQLLPAKAGSLIERVKTLFA